MRAPLSARSPLSLALLMGLTLGAATAAPGVSAQQTQQTYTNGDVTVFAAPSPDQVVVGQWPNGVPVTLYGCLPDRSWCEVSLGSTMGWVSSASLIAVEEQNWSVPIVVYSGATYYDGGGQIYIGREHGRVPPGWHRGNLGVGGGPSPHGVEHGGPPGHSPGHWEDHSPGQGNPDHTQNRPGQSHLTGPRQSRGDANRPPPVSDQNRH